MTTGSSPPSGPPGQGETVLAPSASTLPRGRHGLSRQEVASAQRSRMMLALAEAMAEKGYAATSVADVLARARVSRETFYQQFSSKLDCFLQTFDAAAELLLATIDVGGDRSGSRAERVERTLATYLESLADQPSFARLFLVESYAAGPAAIERRAAVQARLVDSLVALLDIEEERDRFAVQALVAAVGSMVTVPLVVGDVAAVRALRDPLLELSLELLSTAP